MRRRRHSTWHALSPSRLYTTRTGQPWWYSWGNTSANFLPTAIFRRELLYQLFFTFIWRPSSLYTGVTSLQWICTLCEVDSIQCRNLTNSCAKTLHRPNCCSSTHNNAWQAYSYTDATHLPYKMALTELTALPKIWTPHSLIYGCKVIQRERLTEFGDLARKEEIKGSSPRRFGRMPLRLIVALPKKQAMHTVSCMFLCSDQ